MKPPIPVLAALLAAAGAAHADLSFNAGAVTDYRYRGISQSRLKPALQGGVDFTRGGLYLGAWASTIKWITDAGGDARAELDLYGGYRGELAAGVGYDIGVLTYLYPSNELNPSANTTEVYGAVSYRGFSAKYSHSATNLFGFADSHGSGYLDLSASFDLGGGWSLAPHVGYQQVAHNSAFSYWDWSLGLGKTFGAVQFSASLVGTDTDAYVGGSGKDLGKPSVVLGVKGSF